MDVRLNKKIKVSSEYDVVVAGGGMAGFCAAVAASRQGAKTLIIEHIAILGGLGSSGGVGNFDGRLEGAGNIFDEVVAKMRALDAMEKTGSKFDHNVLPIVLQKIALDSKVKLLFHTDCVEVIRKKKTITHLIVFNRSGFSAIKAKVIIDATGEGVVSQFAGAEILDKDKIKELIPPSMMFFMRDIGKTCLQKQISSKYIYKTKDDIPMLTPWWEPDGKVGIKFKIIGHDTGSGEGLSNAEIEAREKVLPLVKYFQENYKPTYKFDYTASILGIREGRRIKGEYVLKGTDLFAGKKFEDVIAVGTFQTDAGDPKTDKRVYIKGGATKVPPYHIPFRSLKVKDLDNLLVAGRCLSADRIAMSSARVMATASMIGHSAGAAAALAIRTKKKLRELNIEKLQNMLTKDKMDLLL